MESKQVPIKTFNNRKKYEEYVTLAIFELPPQVFDLVLELLEHGVLGILVDAGLVLDVLRPVGISQRAQALVVVVLRGTNVGTLSNKFERVKRVTILCSVLIG